MPFKSRSVVFLWKSWQPPHRSVLLALRRNLVWSRVEEKNDDQCPNSIFEITKANSVQAFLKTVAGKESQKRQKPLDNLFTDQSGNDIHVRVVHYVVTGKDLLVSFTISVCLRNLVLLEGSQVFHPLLQHKNLIITQYEPTSMSLSKVSLLRSMSHKFTQHVLF